MGTSRGRALELEVLNAARAWRHYEPCTSTALLTRKAHRLMAAVDALEVSVRAGVHPRIHQFLMQPQCEAGHLLLPGCAEPLIA